MPLLRVLKAQQAPDCFEPPLLQTTVYVGTIRGSLLHTSVFFVGAVLLSCSVNSVAPPGDKPTTHPLVFPEKQFYCLGGALVLSTSGL